MGCCGRGRSDLTSPNRGARASGGSDGAPREGRAAGGPSAAGAASRSRAAAPAPPGTVRLRYLQRSPVLVPGPITGRRYAFSGADPVQPVDGRDAEGLVRSGFFARAR